MFILVGVGSVPAVLLQNGPGATLSGADLGIVALTFGLVIAGVCYTFGPISGSHINPAITVALAATRRFPVREVPAYVLAQAAGAINPARAFGPLVISTLADSVHNWGQWVGYVLAETLGACLAAFAFFLLTTPRPDVEPGRAGADVERASGDGAAEVVQA